MNGKKQRVGFPLGFNIGPGALSPLKEIAVNDIVVVISGVETADFYDPFDDRKIDVMSCEGGVKLIKTVDVAFCARHGGGLTHGE